MRQLIIFIALFLSTLTLNAQSLTTVSVTTPEQKNAVKEFKKLNKPLIKELEKKYQAEVEIHITSNGTFYLLFPQNKDGIKQYLLAAEDGHLLYPSPLAQVQEVMGLPYFWILRLNGNKYDNKEGILKFDGTPVLAPEYNNICIVPAFKCGQIDDLYVPDTEASWFAVKNEGGETMTYFFTPDGKSVRHQYNDAAKPYRQNGSIVYYWTIDLPENDQNLSVGTNGTLLVNDSPMPKKNRKLLLAADGRLMTKDTYDTYTFIQNKPYIFLGKLKPSGGYAYGMATIGQGNGKIYTLPAIFQKIDLSDGTVKCRVHYSDPMEVYDANKVYTLTYKDKGEELLDNGKFKDVITYYEGEGFGDPMGNYYMGMASEAMAEDDYTKMNKSITALQNNSTMFLPFISPSAYDFNYSNLTVTYLNAVNYYDKFLLTSGLPANNPAIVYVKKRRGQLVTTKNDLPKLYEQYITLHTTTATQYELAKANQQIQLQQQQQANQKIANSIVNSIFSAFK